MWPRDFPLWWAWVQPLVFQNTRSRLATYRVLTADGATDRHVGELARQATRATFDRADERQAFPRYFADPTAFRLWGVACGYREALRLLPAHPFAVGWFDQLPDAERSLLLGAYVDQWTDRQLAQVLQVRPDQAWDGARAAYRSLCAVLRANGWGQDDDHVTFPPPPLLSGVA